MKQDLVLIFALLILFAGCASAKGPNLPGPIEAEVPEGMVAFFTSPTCPTGWQTATYATGRLVVAISNTDEKTLLGTVGDPLADTEDREHRHGYEIGLTLNNPKSIAGTSGCCNERGAAARTHNNAEGITGPETSGLPFTQLVICELNGPDGSIEE